MTAVSMIAVMVLVCSMYPDSQAALSLMSAAQSMCLQAGKCQNLTSTLVDLAKMTRTVKGLWQMAVR